MANYDAIHRIYWLYEYHKYRLGIRINQNFDKNCRLMLDLKNETNRNFSIAVRYFSRRVGRFIDGNIGANTNLCLALAPSSTAGKWSPGLCEIAASLRESYTIQNTGQMLRRRTSVLKATMGGPRNIDHHKNTIEVIEMNHSEKSVVLLIDDITTTGSTLLACKELLNEAGYSSVLSLALGKTVPM